ncbi:hypothetical protein [Hymenobacter actinosclerus]|uniref:Uncharacterized protein n=1 Tax=Hymenobacter actinosclerus TaxID=82805 RepID=A0A1I0H327_9BACT|nr:hypothetical protein [Hymenobacter actinosclerus]SET77958.1 hypothetical protein SAMN04487998_2723 [Hymenobacter actinosclerus]
MQHSPAVSHTSPTAPASQQHPVTEADFHSWLQELLPGLRAALARQGFEKARNLSAFQHFLRERANH